jgi:hypothetical protein
VSVKIAMQNGVSSVLKVIQKDVLGLGAAVDFTQGKFNRMKLAVVGAGAMFAGGAALAGFKALADAGGQVLNAQAKMLQIGISQRDVAIETAVAYKNMSIAGTTAAGNINNLTTLRGILGTLGAANAALPAYSQAQFALSSRGVDPGQLDQFVKALDLMGAFNTKGQIDPAKFGPAIQQAVSAVLTTNGLLTGQGFYQAVRLSGPAASAMGEKAYLQNMVEILLALGNRGARGLEYGATTFIGGQMSKNSAMMMDRLGLTKASDYTHEGGRWSLKSGKIQGADMLDSGNIVGWIQKYFLPDAAKAGLSPLQAAATLPQTLQLLITTIANMAPQMARSVQQQAQAQTANPYQAGMLAFGGATQNFESALTSLWQVLGVPAAQTAVTVLNELAGGIRTFGQWVGAHPTYAKVIDDMLLGLGVGLTALGAVAVGAALVGMIGSGGTLALVAAGIVTLGTAMTVLANAIPSIIKHLPKWMTDSTNNGQGYYTPGPRPVYHPNSGYIAQPAMPAGHYVNEHGRMVYQPYGDVTPPTGQGSSQPIVLHGTVAMDGKKVGAIVAKVLAAPGASPTGMNLRSIPPGGAGLTIPGSH